MPLIDPLGADFAYIQVADSIARRIKLGEYAHRLPGERVLAEEYGCAYQTVRHAVRVLRERGLVTTNWWHGTFVAPEATR
jgi:DNA-binding GntR family transcriptional regulator